MRLKSYRDFWAAMLFAVISLVFLWQSAGLAMGTAARMGPAYMPRMLCILMLIVAAVLFVRSLRTRDDEGVALNLRPMLIIPAAMMAFALALYPLGLVIAVCLSVTIASFSDKDSRPVEVFFTALFLSIFSVAVFAYGLKLNLPLWPGA
ncbi:tripartite tricarboxylate transporter TctB family protein [Oryzicola mucosus]|uniref:Tripartite tricarboxylate transporter TctB family protein n=1 Tax=Oryzicola mucosus TaxID=2767425 RepID=A0A8J6PZ29_9HYPH|nr:tripartite tricarboxylate transporter TctB family protein [Oryzicola mucosus]MBD0417353.1 tripartite tricarboxylate transporter TctB family protein [Oryzicola mucosus]